MKTKKCNRKSLCFLFIGNIIRILLAIRIKSWYNKSIMIKSKGEQNMATIQKNKVTEQEKQEIQARILKGDVYAHIAKDMGRSPCTIQCIAREMDYQKPSEEIRQDILEKLKMGKNIKQIQLELGIAREIIKQIANQNAMDIHMSITEEKVIAEAKKKEGKIAQKKQQQKQQQKEEKQQKLQQLIENMIQDKDIYQETIKALKKELQTGNGNHTATIAAVLLEKGEIRKANQVVDLGIQMVGQGVWRDSLLKVKNNIRACQMLEKRNNGWDWETLASYYQVNITKAKELVAIAEKQPLPKKEQEVKEEGIDR